MGMTIPKQVLGRCPSCLQSFVRFWCQQACAPDESDYLQPHHIDYEVSPQAVFHADEPRRPDNYISSSTYINLSNDGVIESNNGTTASPIVTTAKYGSVVEFEPVNGTSLTTLDFYLSEVYLNKLWQSCKNVQYSAAQTPAVQMMCGSKGVNCTGKDWIGYMGDPAVNPYVPFKVNWKYVSDGEHKLLNATQNAIPCNQPVDDSSAACSCQDCHAACGPDIPYPSADPVQCYFAGVDCYTFLSLFVFSGFTFILFVMFILQFLVDSNSIFKYASSSTDDIPSYKGAPGTLDETEISYRERFGHHFERQMEKTCVKWGHICYRHPIMVFIFGLSVSLVLSSGCVWLRFTTDPVELWSAPGSRARNEKDFFDENFGPFFRTEQLIVKPVNQEFISVIDPESFDEVWLGPVFNETLLERVLVLQNTLVNITGQVMLTDANGTEYMHTVRLGDICFKPMAPDHDDCTIQSALNWFQNNVSALRLTGGDWGDIDFRNHMRSCIDAPTLIDDALPLHLSCLGTYGGPIFPYVALGGFNKSDDYMTARALVITFVVVNSQQPEHVAKAEAWEQEFITYLTNFTSPDFNVSFMAERSIQDEIKRQSHSDVLTIVVSYLFMFGYIAFALGQYNVDGDNLCSLLVHSKETRVLPVKEHCTLKTAQFGAKATEIHHPNNIDYKRTNCRGIKNTIESTRLNCFQAFDIDEEQPATIQSKQLHTNIVKSTISQYHPNKLINKPPPKPPDKVDILERGLSRADRVLLAQLRSNYCSSLKQYRTRVGLSNDPTCPRCKKEEETTIHALECRGIDPILLWESPADVIAKW